MQINKKFVNFGTGANQVNSRDLPANFTAINYTPDQVGSEGTDKVSAHLKGIDNRFAVLAPAGDIGSTSFTGDQAQTSAAVTGLSFSSSFRSFTAYVVVEVDATADLFEYFTLTGIRLGASWALAATSVGQTTNVTFSINSSGQVEYSSGSYSGFTSLKMRFRATTLGNA